MGTLLLAALQITLGSDVTVTFDPPHPFEGDVVDVVAHCRGDFKFSMASKARVSRVDDRVVVRVDARGSFDGGGEDYDVRACIGRPWVGRHIVEIHVFEHGEGKASILNEQISDSTTLVVHETPDRLKKALEDPEAVFMIALDLGNDDFETREAATAELVHVGRQRPSWMWAVASICRRGETDPEVVARIDYVVQRTSPVEMEARLATDFRGQDYTIIALMNVSNETVHIPAVRCYTSAVLVSEEMSDGRIECPRPFHSAHCEHESLDAWRDTSLGPGQTLEWNISLSGSDCESVWDAILTRRPRLNFLFRLEPKGHAPARGEFVLPLRGD